MNTVFELFSRVYGFVTGNVFPKIVFHEKQYFYVPPTLLGDIQKGDTKFSAYDIRMFLEPEYLERTTDHMHGQTTGKLYRMLLRVECALFVIYKAGLEPTPYW
jgi:hypothetical protein